MAAYRTVPYIVLSFISIDFEISYSCMSVCVGGGGACLINLIETCIVFVIQVTEDEKVSTVKELIFQRLNIPANQQRLLYKGKALAGWLVFFVCLCFFWQSDMPTHIFSIHINYSLLVYYIIFFYRWTQTKWLLYWAWSKTEPGYPSIRGEDWSIRCRPQQQDTRKSVADSFHCSCKTLQPSRCLKSPWKSY